MIFGLFPSDDRRGWRIVAVAVALLVTAGLYLGSR